MAKQLGMEAALALRVLEADGDGLARKDKARDLISLAMQQLEESSQLANKIRTAAPKWTRGHEKTTKYREAIGWECIGYRRLSLCYAALGSIDANPRTRERMFHKAAKLSGKAARVGSCMSATGSSVLPMCQFFRGHVFLMQESRPGNIGSLREVIDVGADLDVADPEGSTALDHAVLSGDAETKETVLKGLRRQLALSEDDLADRRTEARLRKAHREILQEKLRPVLYEHSKDADCIKDLRRAYAETLAADPEKRALFDHLKFMRYTDFKWFGRLPHSSDGLAQAFVSEHLGGSKDDTNSDALIFFSYRWINQDPDRNTPDGAINTQYRRMIDAAELFLEQNPSVRAERLGVWMDFACVDQDNPATGVSALPIVTLCDAVFSLVDDMYYERAGCCVEAKMISELTPERRFPAPFFYQVQTVHRWYEHIPAPEPSGHGGQKWILQPARRGGLPLRNKKLTFERDRPKTVLKNLKSLCGSG
ncbi:uncharacterized protein B0T15DRAFT_577077 [Chaetomium strumarium]|uniref:Ankyrin repeat protein n=1 Tax=Chaetomium strumarium TaxID=1170767 RepID=A0AAJ0GQ23_9PEZI|nr:hypothetical protein B0T15DRAFT_577077 [Chaetomium strumarium]